MKRKLLPLLLTVVLVVAAALVPMLGITAAAEEETPVLVITADDFNSTSYAANNNTKIEGDYSYTSYQVMKQSGVMQWQKSNGYITINNDFTKLELDVAAGTYTVTVGGKTVTGTKSNNVTTYDLSGLTGEIKISVTSDATGKVNSIKFYKAEETNPDTPVDPDCEHVNKETTTVPATKGEAGSITVTCKDCGAELEKTVIDALGWTSTFVTPEGVAAPIVSDDLEITMPTPDPLPEGVRYMYAYEFAGWAKAEIDGETTETPELYNADDTVTLTADTTFYAVYKRAEGGTGESGWIETTPSAIKPGNVVVIVWTKTGGTYAPSNDKGTGSAPAAVSVTVSNGKITSEVADNIKWNVSYDSGNITIYPNGTTETWMYCTNTNNGVRVGTNTAKTFVIDGNYLKHEGTGRYLGIYSSQDLRCYTSSTTDNIKNQTVAFYVYTEDGTAFYSTTLLEDTSECEHVWDDGVILPGDEPTCDKSGTKTYTCTKDSTHTKTEIIEALGHDWDDGVILEGNEPSCTEEGIKTFTCQNDKTHTRTETVEIIDHEYGENHLCTMCGKVDPMSVDYSGRYCISAVRSNTIFWITYDLGTASTKRYQASNIASSNTIFVIEKNEDGTYCIYAEGVEGDNYLGYTSGNSGTFVAQNKALNLTIDVTEDGLYNIHFAASDGERYLALNGSTYNYFAWYKPGQVQDLSLVTPSANIDGATVSAGADLSVNYYVTLVGYNANDLVAKITMNGKTVEVLATVEGGKVFFKFTGIAPQQMGDNIEFVLYLGEQEIASYKTYSVATNLKNLYNDAGSSAELKALVSDMLYYGAAAQKFTGYKTAELVTAGFEGAQSTKAPTFDEYDRRVTATTNAAYYFKSAGVQFDSQNRIYVKIVAPSIEGLTVTVGGVALELEAIDEGMYIAYSAGLSATDLDTQLTFILTLNSEQIQELSYSANGYIYMMRNDADMKELAVALFNYGQSAEAYEAAKLENN